MKGRMDQTAGQGLPDPPTPTCVQKIGVKRIYFARSEQDLS